MHADTAKSISEGSSETRADLGTAVSHYRVSRRGMRSCVWHMPCQQAPDQTCLYVLCLAALLVCEAQWSRDATGLRTDLWRTRAQGRAPC
jgi:hypothetical protein